MINWIYGGKLQRNKVLDVLDEYESKIEELIARISELEKELEDAKEAQAS